MSGVTTLEREMFSDAEAARLLEVPVSTLRWWLEGGTRNGRSYSPVIRERPTGAKAVTWGEFIEAGLLRQYRRVHKVELRELRVVIDRLRSKLGVPYPLAHEQPFIGPGRKLMLEYQQEAGLEPEMWLVAIAGNQPILTAPSESFIKRVEWKDGVVYGWRPHNDPHSPVRMFPDVRFGLPAIAGIRTEIVWEHVDGGEDPSDVGEQFGLSRAQVRWALAYETSVRDRPEVSAA